MRGNPITTLFLDIGNVLLTNGWDCHMRKLAAIEFGLDKEEVFYVGDRRMFVEIASGLGIHGVHHTSLEATQGELKELFG